MSRSLNKVMLIGNVGSEPEIRATASGSKVAKLSLATNQRFKDRNDQFQDKTEWHRLTFFGRVADVVEQYVHKGDRIYVEGRLEYSQSQDDQGGVRYWTDIVANELVLLGSGSGGGDAGEPDMAKGGGFGGGGSRGPRGPQGGSSRGAPSSSADPAQTDDDLPF